MKEPGNDSILIARLDSDSPQLDLKASIGKRAFGKINT